MGVSQASLDELSDNKTSISVFGQQILTFQYNKFASNENGTIIGNDMDALHDMRVASRRMRTALDVFQTQLIPKFPVDIQRKLKKIGKVLGGVRDFDVLMDIISQDVTLESGGEVNSLSGFINYCQTQRGKKRKKLLKYFASIEYSEFKSKMEDYLYKLPVKPIEVKEISILKEFGILTINNLVRSSRMFEKRFDGVPLDELHTLRINLKMLRYRLEFFENIFEFDFSPCLNEFKRLQDYLGAIQDIRFIILSLRKYLIKIQRSQTNIIPEIPSENISKIEKFKLRKEKELVKLSKSFPDDWKLFKENPSCSYLFSVLHRSKDNF